MTNKDKLEKLKKLADAMYYAAQQLTTDASRLHKAMDEYHQFIINEYHKEETVSEEQVRESLISKHKDKTCKENGDSLTLEIVSEDFKQFEDTYLDKEKDEILCIYDRHAGLVDGANWQKEQMEKNRVAQCNSITSEQAELEDGFVSSHIDKNNCMPTFLDAIEYGMRLQKEQIDEALLSEVLPCFMHGGEAGEVVAKLEEVLNQKK